MANAADIKWFKENFSADIHAAVQGTVFDVDMLTAVACQETGELWGTMRHDGTLSVPQIVALCCGDTLDADKGRSAFPRTKADLLAVHNGQAMFDIAHAALVAMAEHVPPYKGVAAKAHKFCHGYGVFQYDLQFFNENPQYFLQRRYETFGETLGRALGELQNALKKLGMKGRTAITDLEFCHLAICYNTGSFNPSRGLKQGHKAGDKFYGENIRDYLAMARTIAVAGAQPVIPVPAPGQAPLPVDVPVAAAGPWLEVDTTATILRLRSQPVISQPETANVIAEMPDGQHVRAISNDIVKGFREVTVDLGGKTFRGFAWAKHLIAVPAPVAAASLSALPAAVMGQIPEAHLAHKPGIKTRRTANATAMSLNEDNMPSRTGTTPDERRAQIAGIIAYLASDNVKHARYWPRDGLTFCNIYAHDFYHLAGAYLPRVWWNGPALLKIATGQTPPAKIGNTVDEVRANDLFRWLRDFGQEFGWRRAASLDEIQAHANLGGLALIVARRKQDGKSGHIVAVVPETGSETAKRDAQGTVVLPLQSQAGAVNFQYGHGSTQWWLDARFAESALWVHG